MTAREEIQKLTQSFLAKFKELADPVKSITPF